MTMLAATELRGLTLAVAVSAAAVGSLAILYALKRKRNVELVDGQLVFAGTIGELCFYPFKSFKGIPMPSIHCGRLGVSPWPSSRIIDRGFVVVYGDANQIIGINQEPTLVLIEVSFDQDSSAVTLTAPEVLESISFIPPNSQEAVTKIATKIYGTVTEGLDCGDAVADWISSYLGKPGFRVIYRSPDSIQDVTRDLGEVIPWSDIDGRADLKYRHIAYQVSAPVLVTNSSSLTDLNSRMENPITMRNFRPNVVVEGPEAWDEDEWEYLVACDRDRDPNFDREARRVVLRRVTPTPRCPVPTVCPATAVRHPHYDPIATLSRFHTWGSAIGNPRPEHKANRSKSVFGDSMGVVVEGELRAGDAVWVCKRRWMDKK